MAQKGRWPIERVESRIRSDLLLKLAGVRLSRNTLDPALERHPMSM
jgi:hypothetical protein